HYDTALAFSTKGKQMIYTREEGHGAGSPWRFKKQNNSVDGRHPSTPVAVLPTNFLISFNHCDQCSRRAPSIALYVTKPGGTAVRVCRSCYLALEARVKHDAVRRWIAGERRAA